LTQVFVHVLLNAAQSLVERGGVISVTTESAEGRVTVRIADNGAGIAPADLAHVFEPYFTTRPPALGLGLALAREIITRQKGTIDIDSAQGSGTMVTVRLAARPSTPEER
jgi:signal transduction histidine kinase